MTSQMKSVRVLQKMKCYFCEGSLSTAFSYHEPPYGETCFSFSDENYSREVLKCDRCGHFMSMHEMDDSALYEQDYVSATYGGDRFLKIFEKIIALDESESDNVGRCKRLIEFAEKQKVYNLGKSKSPTILDVGSGLCVFLYEMRKRGWTGTALDPDPRAIAHAQDIVNVDAVCGDFFECDNIGMFDVVTFNKVLEHVRDPIAMLSKSKDYLDEGGFVYIELPDGEAAAIEGAGREEFFVEHHHIFSPASIALLAMLSGLSVASIERLQEPSNKYTLRAFLVPQTPSP
jgi:2-polyprenyl-3-methyl-5-hydroxy-6-metoxy-1,4-benzoquinol methylase